MNKKNIHVVMISLREHSFYRADRVYKAFYDEYEAAKLVNELKDKIDDIKPDDENRKDKYDQILGILEDYGSLKPSLYIVCNVDVVSLEDANDV
jgi:hypothetical protein